MDSMQTPRFAIPLLVAGQAHKELFHNEALVLIDFLSHPVVQSIEEDPSILTPVEGDCFLVGPSPIGDWEDFAHHVAGWSAGGWRFIAPTEAMQISVALDGSRRLFTSGGWQAGDAVSSPDGGTVVDVEARTALDSILAILRTFGIVAPQP